MIAKLYGNQLRMFALSGQLRQKKLDGSRWSDESGDAIGWGGLCHIY